MDLDLSKVKLVTASSIKKVKKIKEISFIDLKIKDDRTFYVIGNDNFLYLTHNCDGHHIAALLTHLFYKWFTYIIEQKKLFLLDIPLVSIAAAGKDRKYFYSLQEFQSHVNKGKVTREVRYLKGLGSLDEKDWEFVMGDKRLICIEIDSESKKYMEMAFNKGSVYAQKRKKWLSGSENF